MDGPHVVWLGDPRHLKSPVDDLPDPVLVAGKEPFPGPDAVLVGILVQPSHQGRRDSHLAGLTALPDDPSTPAVLGLPKAVGGQGQGLSDPETAVKDGLDDQGVPLPLTVPGGVLGGHSQVLHLFDGQVGDPGGGASLGLLDGGVLAGEGQISCAGC